jgi:hypothetical protein
MQPSLQIIEESINVDERKEKLKDNLKKLQLQRRK